MNHKDLEKHYNDLELEKLSPTAVRKELATSGLELNWEGILPSKYFTEIRKMLPSEILGKLYAKLKKINIREGGGNIFSDEEILNFLDLAFDLKKFDPRFSEKIHLEPEDFKKIIEVVNFKYNGKANDFLHYTEKLKLLFPEEFKKSEFSSIKWRGTDMRGLIISHLQEVRPKHIWEENKWISFLNNYQQAMYIGLERQDLPEISIEDWVNILEHLENNTAIQGLAIAKGKYLAEKIRPEHFPVVETTQDSLDFYKTQFQIKTTEMKAKKDERDIIKLARSFVKIANYLQSLGTKDSQ